MRDIIPAFLYAGLGHTNVCVKMGGLYGRFKENCRTIYEKRITFI